MIAKQRYFMLDVLRFLAFIGVFLDHFSCAFSDYYVDIVVIPAFMRVFTGKFAVCIFAVCLGFLASGEKNVSISTYAVKRYLFFSMVHS